MSQNKKPAKAPSAYSNHFEAMKTLAKCRGIHPTCKLVLLDILRMRLALLDDSCHLFR